MASWRWLRAARRRRKRSCAQGPEGFRLYRQAAEAVRHAGQGQRQGGLRHRRDAARHEVRDAGGMPGVRRQGRQGRRQRGQENSGRAADRRARRSGCRGRRSHVGGQEGPRGAQDRVGRRRERAHQLKRHLAGSARRQRKGRRGRQVRRRYRQGPRHRRPVRRVLRAAIPRACDHGAAERHRSFQARLLRNLDRHADHERGCSRRRRRRPGCRSTKSSSTITCSAAASAASSSPTWWSPPFASPSRSTDRSRWCGPARKTSSTTSIVRSIATRLPRACPTARSSAGNIASAAPRSWRAGCRRRSRRASTSTPSIARSICPTTFPISMSNMSGPNRRRCRPGSGAASAPTTMCLPSNASWTNWRARPARIRSRFAAACSARIRACLPRSITSRRNPAGASRCRRASDAASACSRRSAVSSPPWWKRKSTNRAKCICAGSPPRSIPASPSIPTRSWRSSKAG